MQKKLLLLIIWLGLLIGLPVGAENFTYIRKIELGLDDYVLESPRAEVSLWIENGSITNEPIVKMMQLAPTSQIRRYFKYPATMSPASDLYLVKFTPFTDETFQKPPQIMIHYEPDNQYKEVYYYSWLDLKFVKLESERDTINHTLTFSLPNKRSVMFAVFNEPELIGIASWYVYPKYRGELITASRDFAKGTKVKVTNLDNNKEVVVTVQDYGPAKCSHWTETEQRLMGPCQERILDLSKTAFAMIATTTDGIIRNIKVTPVD